MKTRYWVLAGAGLTATAVALAMLKPQADEFEALRQKWECAENEFHDALSRTKTAAEQRKVMAEKRPPAAPFADLCLELAERKPETPEGLAALCWAVCNAPDSEAGQKASGILGSDRLARTNPEELSRALERTRTSQQVGPSPMAPLALEVAKRNLDDPGAARLVTWVCANYFFDRSREEPPLFAEAAAILVDRFPASPDISNFCECLGPVDRDSPPWAGKYEKALRTVLDRNPSRLVQCTAWYALASVLKGAGEPRHAEAEAIYQRFVTNYDGRTENGVEETLLHRAKAELAKLRAKARPSVNSP